MRGALCSVDSGFRRNDVGFCDGLRSVVLALAYEAVDREAEN